MLVACVVVRCVVYAWPIPMLQKSWASRDRSLLPYECRQLSQSQASLVTFLWKDVDRVVCGP